MDHGSGRRLVQPVPHLIVIGLDLTRPDDMGVVAQPVEELRSIGLRINGFEIDVFDVGGRSRAFRLGVDVGAAYTLPGAGHGGKGPEIGEGVDVDILGLSVDVLGKFAHGTPPMRPVRDGYDFSSYDSRIIPWSTHSGDSLADV